MKTKDYSLFKTWILALVLLAGSFTLSSAQTLTMVSPNGGENWLTETTQTITWTNSGDPVDLMIEYSYDNSGYWEYIAYIPSTEATGSYTFQNYLYATAQAKIRISEYSNPANADESDGYFTITQAPVSFYVPYYGESYYRGSVITLSWYTYGLAAFNLEYTIDGGATWTEIVNDYTDFTYAWTAPDLLSDACYIRISDPADPAIYALSPVFSLIEAPTISLVSPNGGEIWTYGQYGDVTWTGTNLPYYVFIEYSADGGTIWNYLGYGYGDPNGGTAQVTVPFEASENALIRVSDPAAPGLVFDISDAPFTLDVPPVIVYYPSEGQQFYNGSQAYVSWLASGIDSISIELSSDNGQSWSLVEEAVGANLGYYYWTLNGTPSQNCLVRLSDTYDPSKSGLSGVFTILETPVITLTSPIGGEFWNTSSTQTISWEYDNPYNYYVYLEYSTDGGQYWNYIGYALTESSQGSYEWITPDLESDQYLIRIRDYTLYFVSDTSDLFSVLTFPETPICVVTVDSATNQNVIVWEKPASDLIDQFVVYKESAQANVYEQIGTANYDEISVFTDMNSNPAITSYRYKIGFTDSEGREFPAGDFHQTIHLSINQGVGSSWNLIWNAYRGFDVATYNIFRSSNGSAYEQIAEISSSFTSYTDFSAPAGTVSYLVEVVNPNGCNPSGRADDYTVVRSNIARNQYQGLGEKELEAKVSIYPNPATDRINVVVDETITGRVTYELTDLLGKIVFSKEVSSVRAGSAEVIATSEFISGMYLLTVRTKDASNTSRIIIRN